MGTKQVSRLATIAAIIVAAVYIIWAFRLPTVRVESTAVRQITVSGEGKVMAKPDVTVVNAAIETEAVTAELAQQQSDQKVKKLVDFLKSQAISEKNIKTTSYNLSPQYVYPPNSKPKIMGYILIQSLQIKIRDKVKAPKLIGNLTSQGVNRIDGVNFEIDEPENLQTQARQEAITKARAQAERTAKALGVRVGRVLSYNEGVSGGGPEVMYLRSAAPMAMGMGGDAPIQAGSQEVRVQVTISFEIR